MTAFPLRYAHRNLLIGSGGAAAALYRLQTLAYPYLPAAEKWAALRRVERFARGAAPDLRRRARLAERGRAAHLRAAEGGARA